MSMRHFTPGKLLVDIHGQNEGRALFEPEQQRSMLDAYGELHELVVAFQDARQAHDQIRRKRESLASSPRTVEGSGRFWNSSGTKSPLPIRSRASTTNWSREAHRQRSSGHFRAAAAEGYALLYEADRSAQDVLKRVARTLEPLAEAAPEMAEAAMTLERLADEAREVAFGLRSLEKAGRTTRPGSTRSRRDWPSTAGCHPVFTVRRTLSRTVGR